MRGVHKFQADITAAGPMSTLVLDGVDLSGNLRGFTVRAGVDGTELALDIARGHQGQVKGFVDALVWLSRLFLVYRNDADGGLQFYGLFTSAEDAATFISEHGYASAQIDEVACEVKR